MTTQSKQSDPVGRLDRGSLTHKSVALKVNEIGESGSFDAYVAVFGNVDRQGDVIVPGAFINLDEFMHSGWIALSHEHSALPVAMIETAMQDDYGLRVTGRFHGSAEAQACRGVLSERLAAGKSVSCSIGFRVVDSAAEMRDGRTVTLLKAIEIYEASFVNFPANSRAQAVAVKGADLMSLDQIEMRIDSYKSGRVLSAASRSRLKALADGLHGHGGAACAMAKDLRDWLAQYDDDQDDDDEEEEEEDVNESKSADAALRLRVESGRLGAACP